MPVFLQHEYMTFGDALALALRARDIAQESIDSVKSDSGPAAICVIALTPKPGSLVPTVALRMDGAMAPNVQIAINMCVTALDNHTDGDEYAGRVDDGEWDPSDTLSAQTAQPKFVTWNGAVLLYGRDGKQVVGALAVAGPIQGARVAKVAAQQQEYRNF